MLRSLRPAWQIGTGAWRLDPARWSALLVLSLASAATGAWAALLMLALALALGAWLALFLGAGLHHLPDDVPQFDPVIWLASAIVLTLVVVAASLPAWRRISRIIPTTALDGSE